MTCLYDGCGKTFDTKEILRHHIETIHNGLSKHMCPFCNKEFGIKHNLERHIEAAHQKAKKKSGKAIKANEKCNKILQKSKKCPICQKEFRWRKNIRQHLEKNNCQVDPSKPLPKKRSQIIKDFLKNMKKVGRSRKSTDLSVPNEQDIKPNELNEIKSEPKSPNDQISKPKNVQHLINGQLNRLTFGRITQILTSPNKNDKVEDDSKPIVDELFSKIKCLTCENKGPLGK